MRSIFAPHVELLKPNNINSKKLEQILAQGGCKIVEKPKYRYDGKITNRRLRLVYDDGSFDYIQWSTIAPLINRGVVGVQYWIGGYRSYHYPNVYGFRTRVEITKACE